MWDDLFGEEGGWGRGMTEKEAGALRDLLKTESSRLVCECAMDEANESCLRGEGDPMKDGVTEK